jgi:VCBS repeat-containing protein
VAVTDSKTVAEDSGATMIDVRANDTDIDAGPKTITAKTNGAHGQVVNNGSDLTYAPDADYCGADSFTYTLNGGSTATVSVTVTCVDDNPVAVNDSKTINEDDPATTVDVLGNDTDVDAGPKTISSRTNGAHGAVVITNSGADLTYAPDADFCGADSFTYTLNGGSTATVSVTVTCVDDNPVAVNDSKTLTEDDPATTIDVLANDTDIDAGPKTVNAKTNGAHGTVNITNAGADISYTPAANYCGADSFTYTLNGGSTATVNLNVACVDDEAPETQITESPKAKVKTKKSKATVQFSFVSTEPGSTFTCKLDQGAAVPCGSPQSYKVKAGTHTFTVTAKDAAGNADSTPATFSFKVVRKRH